jgi:hypothetical protein
MRLWSIHPTHLDTKGLVAVWREGLLALHVLQGKTKGYTHHPQLIRFQNHPSPIQAITAYLHTIVDEADLRKFSFDREKLGPREIVELIPVTLGQLQYESEHLRQKLLERDKAKFNALPMNTPLQVHPLFKLIPGNKEFWEKVTS